MRTTFALFLGALGLLSLLVWRLQPSTDSGGRVRLTLVSDNNPLREAQVALFNKEHPGLDLNLDPNNNGVDKVIVQSMGGVGPDLFDCQDAFQLSAYVQSGIAWDVTDELAQRGVDIRRDVFPGMFKTAIYEGRVYGMPTNIAADGIWCHKDLLLQAGIKPHIGPWRWNDLIQVAQKLTTRDAQGHPIRYGFLFDWWNWSHFFKGFGARVYSEDGTRCTVDGKEAIAAVQLMYDLVYKYRVSSSPVEEAAMATSGGFGSGTISMFGAKQAAMALGGRWWLAQLRKFTDLDLGVMESPYGAVRVFHSYARATVINKASPRRRQALEYLVYMSGPDYNNLVNDQADSLCAFKKYTLTERFLHNPAYPKETDNAVWREITERALPDDTSPFVNGQVVLRIMTEQLDLVKADQKTPDRAMKDAAAEINGEIQKALKNGPGLAERYRRLTPGRAGAGLR